MNNLSKRCGGIVKHLAVLSQQHQKLAGSVCCIALSSHSSSQLPKMMGPHRNFSTTPSQISSTDPRFRSAIDRQALEDSIRLKIQTWDKHTATMETTTACLKALHEAYANNIALSPRECAQGLHACSESKTCDKKLPFWLFNQLKTEKVVPSEIFENILRFCFQRRMIHEGIEIIELFQTIPYGTAISESLWTTIISILVKGPSNKNNVKLLQNFYEDFRQNKTLGWRLNVSLYFDIAVAFCKNKQGALSLNVLDDLTKAHHDPSAQLCEELLRAALFHKEAKVLRVLASWYANSFHTRLEYGILNRMLQVAACEGDGQLAVVAFQMLAQNGYHLSKNNYLSVIRASLKSDDLIGAIEILQDFENSGGSMTVEEYRSLKHAIVGNLTVPTQQTKAQKNTRLDDLYYALVDQKQSGGQVVPMVVLDAILESAGKLESVDRAFATFQDYQKVFEIQPTTETYNSLLISASWHRDTNSNPLLSIFQDMDAKASEGLNCAPNSLSYAILVEALIAKREKAVLGNVIAHMDSLSILPTCRASRRLLNYLRKNHVHHVPEGFLKKLESQTLGL